MKLLRLVFGAAFVLIFLSSFHESIFAGTTGKIRGTVKDSRTGNELPGANVIVSSVWEGDQERPFSGTLGAAADAGGEFVILNVPPGIYSVTARMMGYAPFTHRRVQVFVDRTLVLNFALQEEAIAMGEVVVEATRDLVQVDVAASENYVTEKEYRATPFANRVEDVIGMTPGVTGNIIEGEITIREGEAREVGFLLDGMSVVDRKFNRPVITINPSTVEEIKIMRSGFNAEYGEARSGIINIVTKEPGDQFHLDVDYQLKPAQKLGRSPYDRAARWEYRLLDGPRAFEGDSLFLNEGRTGRWMYWRGWNQFSEELLADSDPNNDLSPQEARELWLWRHRPNRYREDIGHTLNLAFSGRVPFLPWKTNFLAGYKYESNPFSIPQSRDHYGENVYSLKLTNYLTPSIKLSIQGIYSQVASVTEGMSTSEWSEEDRVSYGGGSIDIFYPYRKPTIDRYVTVASAKFLHTVSSRTFYELNFNYFYTKWNVGRGAPAPESAGRYFGGRLYLDPQSGWISKERGAPDLATGYRMFGGALTSDHSFNRRTVFSAAVTSQFRSAHELKAGVQLDFDVLREDRLHYHNEDSSQVFTRFFHVKPYEISLYLQDKIEFKGMVANIGVRFDYFNVNTDVPALHKALGVDENGDYFWVNSTIYQAMKDGTYPTFRPPGKSYLSPRVGISHPLTENSKIYFNYGHFVQVPATTAIYSTTLDGLIPRVQSMANGDLTYEKNISYELGFDQNFKDRFQLHAGAFYKDYHDVLNGMVYAHPNQSLVVEWVAQREYREVRGIEIELRKARGRYLTGFINYNLLKKAVSDLSVPNLSCCPILTDEPSVGINGELRGVPRSVISSITPYARGIITLQFPDRYGPKLAGFHPLEKTSFSASVFYRGREQRRHPSSAFRDAHPDVIFHTIPYFNSNLRISRRFDVATTGVEVYMDLSNLLVSKFRNPPGGRAGEDYYSDLFASGRLDQVGTDELTDPAILNTEAERNAVYRGQYRSVVLGMRMNF